METASKFRAKRIQNARVQAFRHPLLSFNGGVVFDDPNDKENIFLRHTRYWKPVDRTDYTLDFSNFVAGSYIYGGPIYNHFGHFMSEMIHRITLARILNPGQKIVFVAPPTTLSKIPDPPKYIEAILNFIGVNRSDYIVVNVDSTIEELFVIESGSDLGGGPKPYYADFLRDNYRIKDLDGFKYKYGGKKLFVSRSRLNHGGGFLGEAYVEEWLGSAGFEAFFPENISFDEQVAAYSLSNEVVFSEGSACHGTELLGTSAMGKCSLLGRRRSHSDVFCRVLKPRSECFVYKHCGIEIGTIVHRIGSGAPLNEFAVSLYDPIYLSEIINSIGVDPRHKFDTSKYADYVRRDFKKYVDHHKSKPSPLYYSDNEEYITQKMGDCIDSIS